MIRPQFALDLNDELIIDNFAGGGGASTGIELALGRHVDFAINHDEDAVAMHEMNHPQTDHKRENVWAVDPRALTKGRPVGLAWFSPDCKHFSKAKGGKPRDKKIRGLCWVVLRYMALVRPRCVMLENVEEFATMGPLLADGKPCPIRKGKGYRSFLRQIRAHGYQAEARTLRACDYGAPTIRKRLFIIARCDGRPIVWPEPTHGAPGSEGVKSGRLQPWRTAAECIDFSIPSPSIFLTPDEVRERGLRIKRPLAAATERRVARGTFRYVINAAAPFVVGVGGRAGQTLERPLSSPFGTITAKADAAVVAPFLTEHANASSGRNFAAGDPLRTQCAEVKGGHFALVAAFLAKHQTERHEGEVQACPVDGPNPVVKAKDSTALVVANLVNTANSKTTGRGPNVWTANEPLRTITSAPSFAVQASSLIALKGDHEQDQPVTDPVATIHAGGNHLAEVRAFLIKYYGEGGQDQDARDPMHTIPTKDRIALVVIAGQTWEISDIGMRMLEPVELFRAQGFPATYIIDEAYYRRPDGSRVLKKLPKHTKVRMCGNSVSPPVAQALVAANVPEMAVWGRGEKKAA